MTKVRFAAGSQHLFGLILKSTLDLVSHTPGKRMESPTHWEALGDLIQGERAELNLK